MRASPDAADPLRAACDRVVDFLLRGQSPEGCWTDWALPPGPSGAWTTAYVGVQLASGPTHQRSRALSAVARAAQWLTAHGCAGGGWSYNDRIDADADSTAWTIMLLRAAGRPLDAEPRRFLARFQQADGGFATYPADAGLGSWGGSHPDVTAVAVAALLDDPAHEATCERALRYLRAQRRPDGLWNAFWWTTPLYATAACLRLGMMTDALQDESPIGVTLRTTQASEAFDSALLLECLVHVHRIDTSRDRVFAGSDERITALIASLVAQQLPDGSWQSVPILRQTDRACAAPWQRQGCGLVYADEGRLFTSATVLRALTAAKARTACIGLLGEADVHHLTVPVRQCTRRV